MPSCPADHCIAPLRCTTLLKSIAAAGAPGAIGLPAVFQRKGGERKRLGAGACTHRGCEKNGRKCTLNRSVCSAHEDVPLLLRNQKCSSVAPRAFQASF